MLGGYCADSLRREPPSGQRENREGFDFYGHHRGRYGCFDALAAGYNDQPHGSLNLRYAKTPNEAFIRKLPPECWFWTNRDLF